MAGQSNQSSALLTMAPVSADSNPAAAARGAIPSSAELAGRIAFLEIPGIEQSLPLVHAGPASLPVEQVARLEACLRGRPEQLNSLLRGEKSIEIRDCSAADADIVRWQLIPVAGEHGLQGVVCVVAESEHPAPGLADAETPRIPIASLARAIARIVCLRNTADTQRHQIEDLANENRNLRELRDLLQSQIDAQMKLVSSAVHQLRNPLVAIRGYARMALGEELGPITETQRECLGIVIENAARMTALLTDLSRSIAEQPLHCQVFDFVELWRESRDVFAPQVLRKSIDFVEHLPAEDLMISGDRDKLSLVLYKLLANTIKFASPGGRVEARVVRNSEQVSLTVSDTADGIPPELVQKALGCGRPQREEAAPSCGSQKLPISLVQEIVHLHGGEISVTSGINQGWRLTLRLPVASRPNPRE